MTEQKRRIMVKARVTEISAVDRPAQPDALVVLRKADEGRQSSEATAAVGSDATRQATINSDYDHALTAAELLAKGGLGHLCLHLGREQFQAAQVEYVRRNMRPGETEPQATRRLRNDATFLKLDHAWRETQHAAARARAEARVKAAETGPTLEAAEARQPTSAGYMSKADIDHQLRLVAEQTLRPGESSAQAYVRAMAAHPELVRAYREAQN